RFSRDWSSDVCSSDLAITRAWYVRFNGAAAVHRGRPVLAAPTPRGTAPLQWGRGCSPRKAEPGQGLSNRGDELQWGRGCSPRKEIGRASCRERVEEAR